MDPQECLAQIIKIVREAHDTPRSADDMERDWFDLAEAFDNLHGWLQSGGFAPSATGAIFGTGPTGVGYPGMTLQSPPRFAQQPIKHVRSRPHDWRFAIMSKDDQGEDLSRWIFVSYAYKDKQVDSWDFDPTFCCPTCHSKGFDISTTGPLRCTFCDGSEGGAAPTIAH